MTNQGGYGNDHGIRLLSEKGEGCVAEIEAEKHSPFLSNPDRVRKDKKYRAELNFHRDNRVVAKKPRGEADKLPEKLRRDVGVEKRVGVRGLEDGEHKKHDRINFNAVERTKNIE